uniref:transmembrane reductase CYB561D2 isoform X2 n=1 Tax=Myxine glutinosa TaxID=7769 RepID=UPI00358E73B4
MVHDGGATREHSVYTWLRRWAILCAHISCLLLTFATCYVAFGSRSGGLFIWHPLLMSLAFSFFMTEAVLVFSPDASSLPGSPRPRRTCFHWLLQTFVVACSLGGLVVIILHKEHQERPHFTTYHSWFGLAVVICTLLQAFCGPLVLYPKLLSQHFSLARLKVYHATFGLACYVLASTTLALGLNSNWARAQFPAFVRYCFITCPIICALVVTNQVTNGYLMRKRMQM